MSDCVPTEAAPQSLDNPASIPCLSEQNDTSVLQFPQAQTTWLVEPIYHRLLSLFLVLVVLLIYDKGRRRLIMRDKLLISSIVIITALEVLLLPWHRPPVIMVVPQIMRLIL